MTAGVSIGAAAGFPDGVWHLLTSLIAGRPVAVVSVSTWYQPARSAVGVVVTRAGSGRGGAQWAGVKGGVAAS